MDRRQLVQILPLALTTGVGTAAEDHCGKQVRAKYEIEGSRFFREHHNLMQNLMEVIIPSDDQSPGAEGAGAISLAEKLIATSDAKTKTFWRNTLKKLNKQSKKWNANQLIAHYAKFEEDQKSEEGRIFRALKGLTIQCYYRTQVGVLQDLQYDGNAALDSFPTCVSAT
jgi:hypothetical protein